MSEMPQFKHDCDRCQFLGRYEHTERPCEGKYDLYYADHGGLPDTVIARYGDEGEEYTSGLHAARSGLDPVLAEAYRRLLNPWTIVVKAPQ